MIDKDTYLLEIEKLNIDEDHNIKFIECYDIYAALLFGGVMDLSESLVDSLLEYLFKGALNDYNIPSSFISSPIGTVLFTVKFNINKSYSFTPAEASAILCKTKSLIFYDINNQNLPVTRLGEKSLIIKESDLIKYLEYKGLTADEAHSRIMKFKLLKEKKLSLTDIKKYFSKES